MVVVVLSVVFDVLLTVAFVAYTTLLAVGIAATVEVFFTTAVLTIKVI